MPDAQYEIAEQVPLDGTSASPHESVQNCTQASATSKFKVPGLMEPPVPSHVESRHTGCLSTSRWAKCCRGQHNYRQINTMQAGAFATGGAAHSGRVVA